jgi:peptidoglycan-associated lipoprotein
MDVRNSWLLLYAYAVASGTLLGACAHKPAVRDEPPKVTTPPKVSVPSNVTPAASASDRSKDESQDLIALLRESVIHFDFDQAQLTSESQARLQKLADALRTHRTLRITIAGHCDERGTEEYNLALGQKRAEVAKSYLITLGIDPNRIDTISYGEERPIDPQQTDEAWTANRRDEFSAIAAP